MNLITQKMHVVLGMYKKRSKRRNSVRYKSMYIIHKIMSLELFLTVVPLNQRNRDFWSVLAPLLCLCNLSLGHRKLN